MFEQVFKNVDDVLWKEAGCTTELDYTEQVVTKDQPIVEDATSRHLPCDPWNRRSRAKLADVQSKPVDRDCNSFTFFALY